MIIELFLRNNALSFQDTQIVVTGLSDFHKLVLGSKKNVMSTQTKDSLKKLAIIFFSENFYKGKIYTKNSHISFFLCLVQVTEICNNAFRLPHKGTPHTAIYFS